MSQTLVGGISARLEESVAEDLWSFSEDTTSLVCNGLLGVSWGWVSESVSSLDPRVSRWFRLCVRVCILSPVGPLPGVVSVRHTHYPPSGSPVTPNDRLPEVEEDVELVVRGC